MKVAVFTWDDPEMDELLEIHDRGRLLTPGKARDDECSTLEVMMDGHVLSIETYAVYEWDMKDDPFDSGMPCTVTCNNDEALVLDGDRARCLELVGNRFEDRP